MRRPFPDVPPRRRRATRLAATVLSAALLLAGCQTKEQSFGAGGAALGALACGVAGNAIFRTTLGTLGSASACGAAGYFIGSAIGRQLDQQDQARAAAATQRALAVPVRYNAASTAPIRPPARPVNWSSDHGTGARGSAAVVAVQPQGDGGECRTVREVAYIKGEEQTQESKYCRGSDGSWTAA